MKDGWKGAGRTDGHGAKFGQDTLKSNLEQHGFSF